MRSLQITDWCHEIFEKFVPAGGVYIDATMGQGQDTLFLCRLAGEGGRSGLSISRKKRWS